MGDELRFSGDQARELEDADYAADGKEKVVKNPAELHIRVPVAAPYEPIHSPDQHEELQALLDKRGANQRGKPRSRDPRNNPLGSKVYDMNCTWPMYRQPYKHSFRYLCGLYQQSHGQQCDHNHVDGPTATRFLLSCIQQRLTSPATSAKLEQRLRDLAAKERTKTPAPTGLTTKRVALVRITEQRAKAERNLAFAENREQYQAVARVVEELRRQQRDLEAEIASSTSGYTTTFDAEREVAAAMKLVHGLQELTTVSDNYGALAELFKKVNVQLFLRFDAVRTGKRILNKIQGGVVTFGATPPPIPPYGGPTETEEPGRQFGSRAR